MDGFGYPTLLQFEYRTLLTVRVPTAVAMLLLYYHSGACEGFAACNSHSHARTHARKLVFIRARAHTQTAQAREM